MLSGGAGYTEGVFGYVARTKEARAVEMIILGLTGALSIGALIQLCVQRFGGSR